MNTLLVAVDNSDIARKVVSLATEQARALDADVVVLCCVDASYANTAGGTWLSKREKIPVILAMRWMSKTPPKRRCVRRSQSCNRPAFVPRVAWWRANPPKLSWRRPARSTPA